MSANERVNTADVAAVLDRFGGQDLLARGAVNIISLAAIRDRAVNAGRANAPMSGPTPSASSPSI